MRTLAAGLIAMIIGLPAVAQDGLGLWTSADIEKGFSKGFDVSAGFDLRAQDDSWSRWSAGLSLSKRIFRSSDKSFSVKASLSYKYGRQAESESAIYKGEDIVPDGMSESYYQDNLYDYNLEKSYWSVRNRYSAGLSAKKELGRFTVSFKERFQYTHKNSATVSRDKYRLSSRYDTELEDFVPYLKKKSDTDLKRPKDMYYLKTSAGLSYDIPHCKLTPSGNIELSERIFSNSKKSKTKYTAGVAWAVTKHHDLQLDFIYNDSSDEDDLAGTAICLSYKFAF